MTTFSSTSINPEVALGFIPPSPNNISCLFEIIIPDTYNIEHKHLHCFTQVFANISSLSVISDEQEVLFSLSTHFRVKYVGDSIIQSDCSGVLIVLELVTDKGKINSTYFDIVERIENEKDPQVYFDILEKNAENKEEFHRMNWQKCWNRFTNLWSTDLPYKQSLLLTIYDCFTNKKDYLRKTIEMHKNILSFQPNSLSFSQQLNQFKQMKTIPTKGFALYEIYFKQFRTTNTEEIIKCLYLTSETLSRCL